MYFIMPIVNIVHSIPNHFLFIAGSIFYEKSLGFL